MSIEALKDFVHFSVADEQIIKKYKNRVPSEMINVWKDYGFGSFFNGYLKIINPDEYRELLERSYFLGDVSIPIFATAFGDIITWEKNQFLGIVKYRYGENDVISDGFEYFFDDVKEGEFDNDIFTIKKYSDAVKKHGALEYDECFGYVPLLALGGKESVNNIKKVKIREHIALITELVGEI